MRFALVALSLAACSSSATPIVVYTTPDASADSSRASSPTDASATDDAIDDIAITASASDAGVEVEAAAPPRVRCLLSDGEIIEGCNGHPVGLELDYIDPDGGRQKCPVGAPDAPGNCVPCGDAGDAGCAYPHAPGSCYYAGTLGVCI